VLSVFSIFKNLKEEITMSIVAEIIGKIAGMGASGIASNLATKCVPDLGKNFRGIKAVMYGLGSAGLGFAAGTAAEKAMTDAVDEVVTSVKEIKDWFKSSDKEDEETDASEKLIEEEAKDPVGGSKISDDGMVEVDYATYCKLLSLASKQLKAEKDAAEAEKSTEEVAE
jgi:hypothetical protein